MSEKHYNSKRRGIRLWLEGKISRIKPFFPASQRQLDLAFRINKVRDVIYNLPDDVAIAVHIGSGVDNAIYLLRLTCLCRKKLIGFVGETYCSIVVDQTHENRSYHVFSEDDAILSEAKYIILAGFKDRTLARRRMESFGYGGKLVELYDSTDTMPFYHVPNILYSMHRLTGTNEFFSKIVHSNTHIASDYYLSIMERIDQINKILEVCDGKRVLVYPAGPHAKSLLVYTDLKYKNIVAFADRSVREFQGSSVRDVSPQSFDDVDCIVVASFAYQDEIVSYLEKLGVKEKILALYPKNSRQSFTANINQWSPDLEYVNQLDRRYSFQEVHAIAEQTMQHLSRGSSCFAAYNVIDYNMIHFGVFYHGEKEIRQIKNYQYYNNKIAIIIQGPIIYDEDFTYRTIQFYQMLFSGVCIILSTWKEEQEKEGFSRIQNLGIEVVLSDPPVQKGVLNLNYQVKSTYAGLLRAQKLHKEYALKTRTDFRINAAGCLMHLHNLIEKFPIQGMERQRLIVLPPYLDVPYYIPDFLLFGRTDDMLLFWDAQELYPNKTDGINPEMLLFSRYFRIIGKYIQDPIVDMNQYVSVLCNDFVIVDPSVFKYIWKKYTYESSMQYLENPNTFTSADWFSHQQRV